MKPDFAKISVKAREVIGRLPPAMAGVRKKLGFTVAQDSPPSSAYGRAFKHGLACGGALLVLFAVWVDVRQEDTAQKIQPLVPKQSVEIVINTQSNNAAQPAVSKTPPAASSEFALPSTALAASKSVKALAPAPIEGLIENYQGRQIPKSRITDDLTPFTAYRKPFEYDGTDPLVSIVVVDYGLSGTAAQSILGSMSDNVSLVLSPYAADATKWAAAARSYGHEFWLALPMQTKNFGNEDSGPLSILTNVQPLENQARLFDAMSSVAGYAGLVTQKDHIFHSDDAVVQPLLKQIFGRGLGLVESNPDMVALGLSMAMEFGYPYAQNNFWLDEQTSPESLKQALAVLEDQAKRKGKAIAFIHPYPALLKQVQEWIDGAEARGLKIAPLSALVPQQ